MPVFQHTPLCHCTSNPRRCIRSAYLLLSQYRLWLRSRWVLSLLHALSSICAFMTCCSASYLMCTFRCRRHQCGRQPHPVYLDAVCFTVIRVFRRSRNFGAVFLVKSTHSSAFFISHIFPPQGKLLFYRGTVRHSLYTREQGGGAPTNCCFQWTF